MEAAAWDLLTTTYSLVNREPVSGLTEPVLLKLQGAGRGRGQAGNWHLLWKEEGKKKTRKSSNWEQNTSIQDTSVLVKTDVVT